MKIAVWHNLPSGGGKRALYYHVQGLVERGHEVACWSLSTADSDYLPLSAFGPERVISHESPTPARGFRQRLLGVYGKELEAMRLFDEACKRCADEINVGDFDVLFANSALPYHMPYVMRHTRIPKLLYLQEPCRQLYEAWPILPWVAGTPDDLSLRRLPSFRPNLLLSEYLRLRILRMQAKQEWLNARSCDLLLVNSYFSRENILRTYGVDARVCYLGIDTKLFRNLGVDRERFIVGLGSFGPIKGVDLAIEAVSLLEQPRPPLVWISNSANERYECEMKELASSLGVDLEIRMMVSDAELVETLNRAALMLYTSKLEPFGLAPLEANACGLPVVAVAEGGVRETIIDGVNGFLVERDAESLAAAASRLLSNPVLAREISETATINARSKWRVELSIDRIEAFLDGCLKRSSNPLDRKAPDTTDSATEDSRLPVHLEPLPHPLARAKTL